VHKLIPALERRRADRRQPGGACELVIGGDVYEATIVNVSKGGLFVLTDADAAKGEPVTVRQDGAERLAVVVHVRRPARSLLRHTPGGLGMRWMFPGS
jgi:hypothetical protein